MFFLTVNDVYADRLLQQGVEERPVNTANDIFAILEGTNKQRRTAETLCNKQSSRYRA